MFRLTILAAITSLINLYSLAAYSKDFNLHDDWSCFVAPFDKYSGNKINILGSLGFASIMHVQDDGKQIISQSKVRINEIQNLDNMRVFALENSGAFAVTVDDTWGFNKDARSGSQQKLVDGWHPSVSYINGVRTGGQSYTCKPVKIN